MATFIFCEGYIDTFVSTLKTLKMFLGGLSKNPYLPIIGSHVPHYMEVENKKFIKENLGWELEERHIQDIDLDKSYIESGDYLPIFRLDGLDQIIMYGTGSHSGHTTMA